MTKEEIPDFIFTSFGPTTRRGVSPGENLTSQSTTRSRGKSSLDDVQTVTHAIMSRYEKEGDVTAKASIMAVSFHDLLLSRTTRRLEIKSHNYVLSSRVQLE